MNIFNSTMVRLRLLGFLEGISLLVLVFVGLPMKHIAGNPTVSIFLGPVHGAIFLLFLLSFYSAGVEFGWKFRRFTWKIIVACFVPFGTFYVDYKYFRNVSDR